ncbi:MAG: Inner spore coat protein [Chthoniobacteraceae bacterium]|nr:Inner spore coat protein [Chthoniobacteraceae bacterium]
MASLAISSRVQIDGPLHAQWSGIHPAILRGLLCAAFMVVTSIANAGPDNVVINEIMYHPSGDMDELQYVELFNASTKQADLSGWTFSKGVKFVFPPNTKMAAHSFLVVCRNSAEFLKSHGKNIPLAGVFNGHLSHNGEQLELSNSNKEVVDAVKYADSAPWPAAADGRASSLERICPSAPGDNATNWAPSKPPLTELLPGTPGRVNDSYSATPPPLITGLSLAPPSPGPGQPVTIGAVVEGTVGINAVTLYFRVAAGLSLSAETALQMKRVSGDEKKGLYEALLPPQVEQRVVRYRIEATDIVGAKRISPAASELQSAFSYSTFLNNNSSAIPWGVVLHPGDKPRASDRQEFSDRPVKSPRGQDIFIYMPPDGGTVQIFDFIEAARRKGGLKLRFLKDQTLRGMSSVNIIFEDSPRYALSEPLSYELFRLAGVPAESTEHIRMWVDGRPRGYQLLFEQPNKSFLVRNRINDGGNLYKYAWYRSGIIDKHEKKTNLTSGHADLLAVLDGLTRTTGVEQWAFIQKNFEVEEFVNYFAVSMCIQNWDGFHNNYFVYHDTEGTGRWQIFPWDEDKTWGDYDGASPKYDWYKLPLTFGMKGSQPPVELRSRVADGGFHEWWREPGYFSGPLLANPQFRQRFLTRLREICTTIFTEEKTGPMIDAMEKRLEPEIPFRARLVGENAAQATARFHSDIQSFRNQLINRRKIILSELQK